ncbi:12930_t:CDS:1 [Acaulospora colombiana]|uniref:12930_t:CDS:1 n=1 Tax=Acaulospora colombiana TaxID=27376 RepID=A0ACA9NPQ3_9GLOM|nr:12930_t:CDS:1 [Acaulospora colombiana]
MLFSNYQLEILVNNRPLEECVEPFEAGKSTTGPSYVFNEFTRKRIENNQTVYAAVTEPGVPFKIRYRLPSRVLCKEPVMAFVYVDGQHDNTYSAHTGPSSVQNVRESFYNYAKGKIYNFMFDITLWVDDGSVDQNIEVGGQGAVSVYFYRAMHLRQNVIPADIDFRSAKIPESRADLGLKLSTSFSEKPISVQPMHESLLAPTSLQPLAALHLHYRAASWLIARNLLIPSVNKSIALSEVTSNNSHDTKMNIESAMGKKRKAREHDIHVVKKGNGEQRHNNSDAENVVKVEDDNCKYIIIKTEVDEQGSSGRTK